MFFFFENAEQRLDPYSTNNIFLVEKSIIYIRNGKDIKNHIYRVVKKVMQRRNCFYYYHC